MKIKPIELEEFREAAEKLTGRKCRQLLNGETISEGDVYSNQTYCHATRLFGKEVGAFTEGMFFRPEGPEVEELQRTALTQEKERLKLLHSEDNPEIEELREWKQSAMEVLAEWDKVANYVDGVSPITLGTNKSASVLKFLEENFPKP